MFICHDPLKQCWVFMFILFRFSIQPFFNFDVVVQEPPPLHTVQNISVIPAHPPAPVFAKSYFPWWYLGEPLTWQSCRSVNMPKFCIQRMCPVCIDHAGTWQSV